ncbi:hypothetical protein [Azospirillum sp. sgz302134]
MGVVNTGAVVNTGGVVKAGLRLAGAAGVLVPMLTLIQPGVLRAQEEAALLVPVQAPVQAQTAPEKAPAVDPEKDTVALESSQGQTVTGEQTAEVVRVGQGLRPDGTEIAPSEVPRPWMIRQ